MESTVDKELREELVKEASNKEARAFLRSTEKLQLGLSSCIQSIALHCYAKELIPSHIYEGLFEGEWGVEKTRAQYFISCVMQRCKESDAESFKVTIQKLAKIIRHDSALEHIAQIIGMVTHCTLYNRIGNRLVYIIIIDL